MWVDAFETSQIAQRLKAEAFVFADPALGDLVQRYRIQVVKFFASAPNGDDELRLLEHREMLRDGLAGHVEVFAQVAQRLTVVGVMTFIPRRVAPWAYFEC